jgi:hypothetical protein
MFGEKPPRNELYKPRLLGPPAKSIVASLSKTCSGVCPIGMTGSRVSPCFSLTGLNSFPLHPKIHGQFSRRSPVVRNIQREVVLTEVVVLRRPVHVSRGLAGRIKRLRDIVQNSCNAGKQRASLVEIRLPACVPGGPGKLAGLGPNELFGANPNSSVG